jgi:hypothetical protein
VNRLLNAPKLGDCQLREILLLNPHMGATKFEALAVERGLGRNRARTWLNEGVLSGEIKRKRAGKNGWRYYLASEGTADAE